MLAALRPGGWKTAWTLRHLRPYYKHTPVIGKPDSRFSQKAAPDALPAQGAPRPENRAGTLSVRPRGVEER